MVIETYQSSYFRLPKISLNTDKLLIGISVGSTLAIPLVLIYAYFNSATIMPSGSLLSPIPDGIQASVISPTPSPAVNLAQLLNFSQSYLDKAYDLSKNQSQVEKDKQEILAALNSSLTYANQAVSSFQTRPEGYLVRANIYTAISKIKPEAISQAQKDLEIASQLSSGNTPSLPPVTNPINLIPDEQAMTQANLIVASPEDEVANNSSTENSNAHKTTIVIPAGSNEFKVVDANVDADTYIYLIPKSKDNPIYVKAKAKGSFLIGLANQSNLNLELEYWLINNHNDAP